MTKCQISAKSGVCPAPTVSEGSFLCTHKCETDDDCPAELKCCASRCGGGLFMKKNIYRSCIMPEGS